MSPEKRAAIALALKVIAVGLVFVAERLGR